MLDFSKKTIVLVSGASRGIGRSIAVELARKFTASSSIFVLLARSEQGLQETKNLIVALDKNLIVQTFVVDLAKPDQTDAYDRIIDQVLGSIVTTDIECGVIFHNAGSVGAIQSTLTLNDLTQWREYYDLNLFSVILLNEVFVRKMRPVIVQQKLIIVNVTSLIGRKPFVNFAMYGSGKAAREQFFRVLALDEPNLCVLNYSPGPVDTDMFNSIIETAENVELKESFKTIKDSSVLTAEQTVGKLLSILEKGDFKSGDTIDYYDRV